MKLYLLIVLLLITPIITYAQGIEASRLRKTVFANLGTPSGSNIRDCTDCAIAANGTCASGGTGATATRRNGAWYCSTGGTAGAAGTVTTVSVVNANGVSGSVTNPTTTPAITLTLGDITPTSVTVNGAGPSKIDFTESTAPSGTAGHSLLYSYATSHRLMMNLNNGGAVNVVASGADINTSDQVIVTHLAAALPVNQGGTGLGSFTAHNVLTGGAAGTALGSVAPGANGNVLTSNGTDWTSAAGGGGVNPTSTFMPYNNAGTFADSPFAVSGGNSTTSGNLTSAKSKGFLTTVVDATGSGSLANPIYGASGGPVAYIGDVFGASDGWVFSTSDSVNEIGFGSGFLGLKSTHVLAWATSTNVSANVAPDLGLSRISAGVLGLGNGSQGDSSAAMKAATATFTTIASDATHTDATVCIDATTGLLLKGSGTIGICLGTSSARFKHDIQPMSSSLRQMMALRPVSFFYNKGYGDDGTRRQFGFTAEGVNKVAPELVGLDAKGQPNSVDLLAMVPKIISAMQEQQSQIQVLQKQVATQQRTIRRLGHHR